MRPLLALLALSGCLWQLASGEEYVNMNYGLKIEANGDWAFSRTAKLEIDLHRLSDAQLTELFQAYEGWGVVRMTKGEGKDRPWLMVQFSTPRGEMQNALEKAQGYQKGAVQRREAVLIPASEREFAGIPAAYLCTQKRSETHHQFFVARNRSYVVITYVVPQEDAVPGIDQLIKELPNIKIDVAVDSKGTN